MNEKRIDRLERHYRTSVTEKLCELIYVIQGPKVQESAALSYAELLEYGKLLLEREINEEIQLVVNPDELSKKIDDDWKAIVNEEEVGSLSLEDLK
jgi:hypothetical protein